MLPAFRRAMLAANADMNDVGNLYNYVTDEGGEGDLTALRQMLQEWARGSVKAVVVGVCPVPDDDPQGVRPMRTTRRKLVLVKKSTDSPGTTVTQQVRKHLKTTPAMIFTVRKSR